MILDDTANLSLLLGNVRQIVSDDLAYIQRIKRRTLRQERRLPAFRVVTDVRGVAAE